MRARVLSVLHGGFWFALLGAAAVFVAAPSPAVALAPGCPFASWQYSLGNLDDSAQPTPPENFVFAGSRIRIGTRCKAGEAGEAYPVNICVRRPDNVVRCRFRLVRADRWYYFIVKTTPNTEWTYRVSWARRPGARAFLRAKFRTFAGD